MPKMPDSDLAAILDAKIHNALGYQGGRLSQERRCAACDVLGRVGGARAIERLVASLDDGDPMLRAAAARSLGALRVEQALEFFPELQERLGEAPRITMERGGISATRRLWVVTQGSVALIGDASGSVDAKSRRRTSW